MGKYSISVNSVLAILRRPKLLSKISAICEYLAQRLLSSIGYLLALGINLAIFKWNNFCDFWIMSRDCLKLKRFCRNWPLNRGLLLLLLLFWGCNPYQQKAEKYLKAAHELWGFDGAILVAKNGRILFSQGYGLANQQTGEINTPRTRFFIGSITKQFTAAAILALEEDHLLNIDDPITKYLSDYPHDPGDRITIRHLLTHTSGIPNYTDDPEIVLRRTERLSPEEIIDRIKSRPLEFEPGTAFNYSNSGYVLLGRIIEIASGQSYEAYLHHRIFRPAGMMNSGYGRREAGIPDRADGYTTNRNGDIVDAIPVEYSILYSAGALYSTIEDMSKWDKALRTDKVLSKPSIEAMFTPDKNGYGYGWFVESSYGHRHAYHGGFLDGFNTTIDRWLDDSLCIVIFSNDDDAPVTKIARGLAAIAFDKPYVMPVHKSPIQLNPRNLEEYEGIYRIDVGLYQIITLERDTLFIHLRGMPLQTLLPQLKDTFFFAVDNNKILAFTRDRNGSIGGLSVMDDALVISAKRLHDADSTDLFINRISIPLDSSDLQRYVGIYEIESESGRVGAGFVVEVVNRGDHLEASVVKNESIAIFPSSETRFFDKETDFQITFLVDEQGGATGCIIEIGGKKIHGLRGQ